MAVTPYPSASTCRVEEAVSYRGWIDERLKSGGHAPMQCNKPLICRGTRSAHVIASRGASTQAKVGQAKRLTVVKEKRRGHPELHVHAHDYERRHDDHGENLRHQIHGMQYVVRVLEVRRHAGRRCDSSNRAGRRHRRGISLGGRWEEERPQNSNEGKDKLQLQNVGSRCVGYFACYFSLLEAGRVVAGPASSIPGPLPVPVRGRGRPANLQTLIDLRFGGR